MFSEAKAGGNVMANERDRTPEKGVGNPEADRRYAESTRPFAPDSDVDTAARDAEEALQEEQEELEAAGAAGGRSPVGEEDPDAKKRP
jgi:hypothetical protein